MNSILKHIIELNQMLLLVRLRWFAIICLVIVIPVTKILNVSLQVKAVGCIILFLILENIVLLFLSKLNIEKKKINARTFSNFIINAQISVDFIVLTVLLHFTGGVENPFIVYYIFHMILAGILLDTLNSYVQTSFALMLLGLLTFFEYYEVVPHYSLVGFIGPVLYKKGLYLLGTGFVFVTTSFLVVFLTNTFVKQVKIQKEEYLKANLELKQKDIIKSEYILRLTHDIKDYLASILANLAIITTGIAGKISSKQSKFINISYSKTIQLNYFINNLLKLTQQRLNGQFEKQEFLLIEAANKAIEDVKDMVEKKSVSMIINSESPGLTIYGNKFSIEESLLNLLSNAVKYSHNGGRVEMKITDMTDKALIEITDFGMGIPENEKEKIFEEFYRGTNVQDSVKDGNGLGLTIVRLIVENHYGKIWVESREGKGSKFSVLLPKINVGTLNYNNAP